MQLNPTIKFSEEWEKLREPNRKIGKIFHTFRGYEPKKEQYYKKNLNSIFDVEIKGKPILPYAKLIAIQISRAYDLELQFIKNDTYQCWDKMKFMREMEKWYGNPNPIGMVLFFEWVEFPFEVVE